MTQRNDSSHHTGSPQAKAEAAMAAAVDWFARRQSGAAAAAERDAFAAWLAADPANREAWRRVEALWEAPAFRAALARRERDADAPQRPAQLWAPARRRRRTAWAAAAAALVVLVTAGAMKGPDIALAMRADAATATGARETVSLPDGSRMTLDTASAVDIAFAGGLRRVTLLQGAAYFDVVPGDARPFVVDAGAVRVRVTGTRFSMRRDTGGVRVAVAEGAVAVGGVGATRALGAGQTVLAVDGRPGPVARAGADAALAWLDGRLVFRDRPLGEVLAELGRYHPGWIVAASDRARTVRVSGSYRLDDPAAAARALADAASLDAYGVGGLMLVVR